MDKNILPEGKGQFISTVLPYPQVQDGLEKNARTSVLHQTARYHPPGVHSELLEGKVHHCAKNNGPLLPHPMQEEDGFGDFNTSVPISVQNYNKDTNLSQPLPQMTLINSVSDSPISTHSLSFPITVQDDYEDTNLSQMTLINSVSDSPISTHSLSFPITVQDDYEDTNLSQPLPQMTLINSVSDSPISTQGASLDNDLRTSIIDLQALIEEVCPQPSLSTPAVPNSDSPISTQGASLDKDLRTSSIELQALIEEVCPQPSLFTPTVPNSVDIQNKSLGSALNYPSHAEHHHVNLERLYSTPLFQPLSQMTPMNSDFSNSVCKTTSDNSDVDLRDECPKPSLIQCNICWLSFPDKGKLKNHKRNHQGPYKCNICSKTIKRKDALKRHNLCHQGKLTHKCHCGKVFPRKDHLQSHKKKCGGEAQNHTGLKV